MTLRHPAQLTTLTDSGDTTALWQGGLTRWSGGMTNAPVIDVDGLSLSYGDFEAVRDVSFEVRPGELYALLGTNGAG